MTDDPTAPAEFLPEARRHAAAEHPGDPMAVAAVERSAAWTLSCLDAVARRYDPRLLQGGEVMLVDLGDDSARCNVCGHPTDRPDEEMTVKLLKAQIRLNRLCQRCADFRDSLT